MAVVSDERALWLARHILPLESSLRAFIMRSPMPLGLDVDDVVQETYSKLAAMESVEAIRNPRTYAFSVARTIVLMHIRRSKVVSIRTVQELDVFAVAADDPSPEQFASDRQQLRILSNALAELPEQVHRAFLMRVIEELPHREIADRLDMTENAVQKAVAKCISFLIKKLGRGGYATPDASRRVRRKQEYIPDEAARD